MSASTPMNAPKSRPPLVEKAPGTFSQMNQRGRISRSSRAKSRASPERAPSMPALFPATLKSWQGVPPTRRSTDPRYSSPFILVMSPMFGTSGNLCCNTRQGKGSISEKATASHPSGRHAQDAASIPEHTERYFMLSPWLSRLRSAPTSECLQASNLSFVVGRPASTSKRRSAVRTEGFLRG